MILEARRPAMRAYAAHLFTASGAVFALLALLAALDARWSELFVWLVVAFVVDGVDGALARRTDVVTHAPIIDGVLLDLVIDFLTYVVIPAVALLRADLLRGPAGMAAAVIIVFASALYFADTRMKTPDRSFSGFPAAWNMLAVVVFVAGPPSTLLLVVVLVLTVTMFLPVKFIHPVRTRRWRPLSLPVAIAWTGLAAWAAVVDFALPGAATVALVAASVYLAVAGAVQQLVGERPPVVAGA